MKLKKIKIIILILITLTMTGCWNYNELNSIAIITSIAIDKEDDKYEISILIANSMNKQSSSEDANSQNVVYSAKGKTLSEALKNIDLVNPRQNYIGHLSSVIISEKVAKEGLSDVLDLLFRNSESTKRFYVAIARKDKAKDVLKIISPLEAFPAQTISTNIKTSSESQAISVAVVYSEFIESIIKNGVEPILPTITIKGNVKSGSKNSNLEQSDPKASLKLGTIALFKDTKLIDYANYNESRGINLALNKVKSMIIQYKCNENYLVAEVKDINTNIDINKNIDTKINIKATGDIIENNCDIDLTSPKEIKKIEKSIKKKMNFLVKKGIELTQKKKVDVYGIGNLVYKKYPNKFKSIKNWNKYFSNLDISINIDFNLNSKGSSKQSLKEVLNGN